MGLNIILRGLLGLFGLRGLSDERGLSGSRGLVDVEDVADGAAEVEVARSKRMMSWPTLEALIFQPY
jgi:hypothetical protein